MVCFARKITTLFFFTKIFVRLFLVEANIVLRFPIATFQLFYDAGLRDYVYNKSLVIFISSNIRLNSKFA